MQPVCWAFPAFALCRETPPVKAALQRIRRLTAGVNASIDFLVRWSFSNGTTLADAVLRGKDAKGGHPDVSPYQGTQHSSHKAARRGEAS